MSVQSCFSDTCIQCLSFCFIDTAGQWSVPYCFSDTGGQGVSFCFTDTAGQCVCHVVSLIQVASVCHFVSLIQLPSVSAMLFL
jgi:hypothetical protein